MLRSASVPRAPSATMGPRAAPYPSALHVLLLGLVLATLAGCAPEVAPPAETPPAPLPEMISSPPAPGMVWVAGCWHRDGEGYVWLPGHWESAPAPAAAEASAAPQ